MKKQPQMRFIVSVDNYGETKHIAVTNARRDYGNRTKKYNYTSDRHERFSKMVMELWKDGRAVQDFTRAYTWGIDPSIDPDYDPYSPEEGRWPYK